MTKQENIMKQAIISIIVIALSILVWLHWGGLSNVLGTFIIAVADIFILNAVIDSTEKRTE